MKKKQIFLIVNPEKQYFLEDNIETLDWNKLPSSIFDDIPEWYYENRAGIDENGNLIDKTVLYIKKVNKMPDEEDYIIYEDNGKIIGVEMP